MITAPFVGLSIQVSGFHKHIDKLEFGGFVELKMFQYVRRERIYPFRPRSGFTASNYLTKGQVIRISSQIYDKNIRKSGFADGMSKPIPKGVYGPFPVQRTMDVHQPFGTDKSVPYEIHRQIPICWAVLAEGRRNCGGIVQRLPVKCQNSLLRRRIESRIIG